MKKTKIELRKGTVGRKAYMVCKEWKLGFHVFKTDENKIFRLCYFRNKHATYYVQLSYQYRKIYNTSV